MYGLKILPEDASINFEKMVKMTRQVTKSAGGGGGVLLVKPNLLSKKNPLCKK